jgi:hypothetical protein
MFHIKTYLTTFPNNYKNSLNHHFIHIILFIWVVKIYRIVHILIKNIKDKNKLLN